jgi:oligopeptide/dipeptide ABC transporter ATP-binding protein
MADRVAVMYAGEIVECAPVAELFAAPLHPYTEALLQAMPRVDRDSAALHPIGGQVPPITAMPPGCAFAPRCPLRQTQCERHPPLVPLRLGSGHSLRCFVRAAMESAA